MFWTMIGIIWYPLLFYVILRLMILAFVMIIVTIVSLNGIKIICHKFRVLQLTKVGMKYLKGI